MAFDVQGFQQPNYQINPVAGNKYVPQDGMTQLNNLLDYQEKQALLQPKIEAGKAESKKKVLESEKAGVDLNQHYANIARGTYGGLLTDPDFISGNKEAMKKKLSQTKEYLHSVGVPEFDGGKQHDVIMQTVDQNPQQAYQIIKNGVQQAGGAQNQYQTIQNAQPPAIYNPTQTNQPQGQPITQPQGQPQGQTQTQAQNLPVPELSQPVPLSYPVRVAGQPAALAPSEIADKDSGIAYRNNLVGRQSQLTTDRRNIDEVVKTANELEKSWMPTSGILGSAYRHLATWAGDPTYIQLSKDLANTTLSNMKALGLNTDADKQLVSAAQGNYTYPPEVLMNIANRAKADMTNIDMQATAAQKFANKFGDNNMKAFQQMWSKNADSKVFEVMNLAKDSNLNAEEKQKIVDKLLGKDPEQRKVFNQKYQNILKLQQNGTL
jgi:hypothetical protein